MSLIIVDVFNVIFKISFLHLLRRVFVVGGDFVNAFIGAVVHDELIVCC